MLAIAPGAISGPVSEVATVNEWRFDILEVLTDLLKGPLDLDGSLEFGVDSRRAWARTRAGAHVSVLIKPVGSNNSATFQRWVTLSPHEADGLREGPRGWRGVVVMVGLLDNGQPWWVGAYDRDDLRATMYGAEQINSRGGGWFYRWDPGLLKPILWKDLLEPEEAERLAHVCPVCGLTHDYPTEG